MSNIPRHIGIIMDGNGRWATKRKLPRTTGHRQGIITAKKIIREAIKLGIPWLTLYVFSTENWKRTQKEVGFLMKLIISHMRDEASFYHENRIRVRHTGDIDGLPGDVQKEINKSIFNTKDYNAITVNLAINYGGRDEINYTGGLKNIDIIYNKHNLGKSLYKKIMPFLNIKIFLKADAFKTNQIEGSGYAVILKKIFGKKLGPSSIGETTQGNLTDFI